MTPEEKIIRLTRLCNWKAVSIEAGLGVQYVFNIVHGLHRLGARPAVALARVLGVDIGWLMDDRKAWPPVRFEDDDKTSPPQKTAA
jgi:hypothetical protein